MSYSEKTIKDASHLIEMLDTKLGQRLLSDAIDLGDAVIEIPKEAMLEVFHILKEDAELNFNFFTNVTAVDWLDVGEARFELVYHLYSLSNNIRLRIKINVPETDPEVESMCHLWSGANFMEREVFDMYGIHFRNHPNLKRILMYEEFIGHPLRKDYPLQAKQPRVKMRYPEVQNTARNMHRAPLVRINPRKSNEGGR